MNRQPQVRLGALLARHREPLLGRIRLMMGHQARRLAESGDFLQELFVELLAQPERWDTGDETVFLRRATWLARNRIADRVRRRREAVFADFSHSTMLREEGCDEETPSGELVEGESHEQLLDALQTLSEDHQRVIELRDFDGMRFDEVAAAMQRSEVAARRLHGRAMLRLGLALRRVQGRADGEVPR